MRTTPLDLQIRRSPSALLGDAVALFVRHAALFFTVTFLVAAPVTLLVDGVWGRGFSDGPDSGSPFAADLVGNLLRIIIVPSLVTALHVRIVQRLAAGVEPSLPEALRLSVVRLPTALIAVLLYTLCVGAGLVALIVPGVWLSVLLYFGAQAVIVDGLGPVDALKRSAALVRGRWWAVFGRFLLAWLAFGLTFGLLEAGIAAVNNGVVSTLLTAVADTVDLSLSALFGTLLFFELRAQQAPDGDLDEHWLPPRPQEA